MNYIGDIIIRYDILTESLGVMGLLHRQVALQSGASSIMIQILEFRRLDSEDLYQPVETSSVAIFASGMEACYRDNDGTFSANGGALHLPSKINSEGNRCR